ncbi:MAG: permease [Bacteroidetes bacterium]|nr:MAG: permease [Bacteroidota bacterium]
MNTKEESIIISKPKDFVYKYYIPIPILIFWILFYLYLKSFSDFIVYDLFGMAAGTHLTESIRFFIYEVPKVMLLLVLIVFVVGIIRSYFSPEKTRKALEGKPLFLGNIMAGTLGIITPFCSCSAIPLFLGFVESGIPLGVTFSFLIAAPMINEVAVVLLLGLFGWQTALIYVTTGLVIAILSGWIIGKLKLEKFVADWVYQTKSGSVEIPGHRISFTDRIEAGYTAVREIVSKVWIYIVVGIGVGAVAHGYVPEDFMASFMGKDVWYSVPLAVLIGIPLYSNAAGIIPVVQVLLEKGASLGTSLAFMMAVIGLSLPETIILKKVLKMPLIFIFIGIVAAGITIVGFLFNLIF